MVLLLGNSGSPRWYDGRFDAYLDNLVSWGASSVELPVHHGDFDERTARVHLLEPDWLRVIDAFRSRGLVVQLHISLDPRFGTDRWLTEPAALQAEYAPVLALLERLAPEQPASRLVVHGAAGPGLSLEQNEAATVGLLEWLAIRLEGLPKVAVAVELTAASPAKPRASCRSRASLSRVVDKVGSPQVGVCWDLAHDFENRDVEPDWQLIPGDSFLRRVVHVHLHDMDEAGEDHYPLVLERVPFPQQLAGLAAVGPLPPLTMEVRWRCAARLGDPWNLLAQSYARLSRLIGTLMPSSESQSVN